MTSVYEQAARPWMPQPQHSGEFLDIDASITAAQRELKRVKDILQDQSHALRTQTVQIHNRYHLDKRVFPNAPGPTYLECHHSVCIQARIALEKVDGNLL